MPIETAERHSCGRKASFIPWTPRAILVISAHWYGNVTAVTAMARPRTIHDFYFRKGSSVVGSAHAVTIVRPQMFVGVRSCSVFSVRFPMASREGEPKAV